MRKLLTVALSRDGHGVDTVESAGEGLRLLLKRRYSLLVADPAQHEISIPDFVKEIRARGFTLPVLILTCSLEETLESLTLELGPAEYLVKPFDLEELRTSVRRMVSSAEPDDTGPDKPHLRF